MSDDTARQQAIARVRADFAAIGRPLDGLTDAEIEVLARTVAEAVRSLAKSAAPDSPPPGNEDVPPSD